MKFCKQCNNMLFDIQTDPDTRTATYKCRACPYEEPISKENPVVYEHDLQQDTSIQYSINPYLKYDPPFRGLPTWCARMRRAQHVEKNQISSESSWTP